MRKIIIAYHIYMTGDHYAQVVLEQFQLLLTSKLFQNCDKLYIGIVDTLDKKPDNGIVWAKTFWSTRGGKNSGNNVEIVVYPDNKEIADTMKWVKEYSAKNPDDYILFFHTKGITHNDIPTTDWRKYMEYFTIERWEACIKKLDEGYDCCGVMWNVDTPVGIYPHYSGAFWWATAKYINTLNPDYLAMDWILLREFWIGSNPNVKAYEFHNSGLNTTEKLIAAQGHYHILYPRNKYT